MHAFRVERAREIDGILNRLSVESVAWFFSRADNKRRKGTNNSSEPTTTNLTTLNMR